MKQKKIKIANGLNKLVYDRDEDPVDGVKLPLEQFALSQMVACLKVFAEDQGFDAMAMFNILMPKFTKEAQEMLEEIKNEKQ